MGLDEAEMIAFISQNSIPFILSALVICTIYGLVHREYTKDKTIPKDDQSIIDLRSDIRRLVDAAESYYEFSGRIQECISRIESSNHIIWLGDKQAEARKEFLHMARICRAMREQSGPRFGGDFGTRSEVLAHLRSSADWLDSNLLGHGVEAKRPLNSPSLFRWPSWLQKRSMQGKTSRLIFTVTDPLVLSRCAAIRGAATALKALAK